MRSLLAALVLFVLASAPYRLIALVATSFVVTPGYTQVANTNDDYWHAMNLAGRLGSMGWTVSYVDNLSLMFHQEIYGATVPAAHTIYIEGTLSWDARYAILAHEGGHVLQKAWMDVDGGECFAESVASLMSGRLREHARYVSTSRWSCAALVAADWPAIYHAAATLR